LITLLPVLPLLVLEVLLTREEDELVSMLRMPLGAGAEEEEREEEEDREEATTVIPETEAADVELERGEDGWITVLS
jgi:hypothetical protein